MKRILLSLTLVIATSPVAMSNPSPAPSTPANVSKPAHKVAPADEYFGRMKMSILGIRNAIKDLGIRAEAHPDNAESIFGTASLTEDAIRDWEHKYPADTWLAKTVFALERMYAKVPTAEGRTRARRAQEWVVARYGATEFAATTRQEMSTGSIGATTVATATSAPVPAAATSTIADVGQASTPAPAITVERDPASPVGAEVILPGEVVVPDATVPSE